MTIICISKWTSMKNLTSLKTLMINWLYMYIVIFKNIWFIQGCQTPLALTAFQQGGVFIMPYLLWHRTSGYKVSSKGPPHWVALYNKKGAWMIHSHHTCILKWFHFASFLCMAMLFPLRWPLIMTMQCEASCLT